MQPGGGARFYTAYGGPGGGYRQRRADPRGDPRRGGGGAGQGDDGPELMARLVFLLPLALLVLQWLVGLGGADGGGGVFGAGSGASVPFALDQAASHRAGPLRTRERGLPYWLPGSGASPLEEHARLRPLGSRARDAFEDRVERSHRERLVARCDEESRAASVLYRQGYALSDIKARPMPGCQDLWDTFGERRVQWVGGT